MAKELKPEEIENTQKAVAVRKEMEAIYRINQDRIITGLISEYRRKGGMNHDNMVGAVAELSGMKEIIDRLTREISQADSEV